MIAITERVHVITAEPVDEAIRRIAEDLAGTGVRVLSSREARFSLEDVFISVVERARQAGKVARED